MKLISSITLTLLGLSYGQVDYESYSDYTYEPSLLGEVNDFLAELEANAIVQAPGITARARAAPGRGPPGGVPAAALPPAIAAFTGGARKLPPGIKLSDFIGPNGFQTQRFLKALQAALKKQADDQKRKQQAAREAAQKAAAEKAAAEKAAAELAAAEKAAAKKALAEKAAAEKAAAEKAVAEAAARKAAEEKAARKAAAIKAAAEAAQKAAEEAAALEAARQQAEREAAQREAEAAAAREAEAERQTALEEQLAMAAIQAESLMVNAFGDYANADYSFDGMVASSVGAERPSSGRPSSVSANHETRDFIGDNADNPAEEEIFNSCRVCNKMTAEDCAKAPLETCYKDVSRDGVFKWNDPSLKQDQRLCLLQTEQRKLTNGKIKTLFTSRCVNREECSAALRQNFLSEDSVNGSDMNLAPYNRCKQPGILKKNGNMNKSECSFCNLMAHEEEDTRINNQFFPKQASYPADEDDYVVFRYKSGGAYQDMKMSALFPPQKVDHSAFPPHNLALWSKDTPWGKLVADAGYLVPTNDNILV